MDKLDYTKQTFGWREQTRWDLSNVDDAATLLMELQELEWRYHHLAMLKYRNHKYKEFHSNFGMYWSYRVVKDILFPVIDEYDVFSHHMSRLDREIEEEDQEMLNKFQ